MIAAIKDRLDIISCLNHFGVNMPSRGRRMVITLCPFHEDKHPSFAVYGHVNRAWCYGCHKGGDVLDITRLFLNCDTAGAIAYWKGSLGLAGVTHIPPDRQLTEQQTLRRLRRYIQGKSLELERFPGIPKVPVMEPYIVHIFSQKDEIDLLWRDAQSKPELLAYLSELEQWHAEATPVLQGAWLYWTGRAMEGLKAAFEESCPNLGRDDLSTQATSDRASTGTDAKRLEADSAPARQSLDDSAKAHVNMPKSEPLRLNKAGVIDTSGSIRSS